MRKKKHADTAILEVLCIVGLGVAIIGYWWIIMIIAIVVGLPILFLSGDDDE